MKKCGIIWILIHITLNQVNFDTGVVVDVGCDYEKPKMCPSNRCEKTYEDCAPVLGCTTNERPLRCPSGLCVNSLNECDTKNYQCGIDRYQRCADGNCRLDCSGIQFNGCPMSTPYLCASGKCVLREIHCTDFACDLNNPILCSSRDCVTDAKTCQKNAQTYDFDKLIQPLKISADNYMQYELAFTSTENKVKILVLRFSNNNLFYNRFSAGFASMRLSGLSTIDAELNVKQAPFSVLQNSKLDYETLDLDAEKLTNIIFMKSLDNLEPFEFVRSFAFSFKLEDYMAPNLLFNRPISVSIKYNKIKNFPNEQFSDSEAANFNKENDISLDINTPSDYYCLGILDPQSKTWSCHSRNIVSISSNTIDFSLQTTGTFAVLYFPRLGKSELKFCGFMCHNKRAIIILCFILIPLILLLTTSIVMQIKEAVALAKEGLDDISSDLPFAKNTKALKKTEKEMKIIKEVLNSDENAGLTDNALVFLNPLAEAQSGDADTQNLKEKEKEKMRLKFEDQKLIQDKLLLIKKINALKMELVLARDNIEKHKQLDKVPSLYDENEMAVEPIMPGGENSQI